jgi:AcrR family transcriptional regulator
LILDAAEHVVVEGGALRLTLDAVAERAGVSKGGLLYHFPSKEALLQAMLERLLDRGRMRRCEMESPEPPGVARDLKCELSASLMAMDKDRQVSSGLLAAVANEPTLLKPVLEFHRERYARLAPPGSAGDRRALLLLAADGLCFLQLLQVSPFDAERKQALVAALFRLAEEFSCELDDG